MSSAKPRSNHTMYSQTHLGRGGITRKGDNVSKLYMFQLSGSIYTCWDVCPASSFWLTESYLWIFLLWIFCIDRFIQMNTQSSTSGQKEVLGQYSEIWWSFRKGGGGIGWVFCFCFFGFFLFCFLFCFVLTRKYTGKISFPFHRGLMILHPDDIS